jgi:hypothetical protein
LFPICGPLFSTAALIVIHSHRNSTINWDSCFPFLQRCGKEEEDSHMPMVTSASYLESAPLDKILGHFIGWGFWLGVAHGAISMGRGAVPGLGHLPTCKIGVVHLEELIFEGLQLEHLAHLVFINSWLVMGPAWLFSISVSCKLPSSGLARVIWEH